MEVSDQTIEFLKNYADIQKTMMFYPGQHQQTVSVGEDFFSKVKLQENIPEEFGIYDLPQFISCLTFIDNPNLKFLDKHLMISDAAGIEAIKLPYADPDHIVKPAGTLEKPEPIVTFTLSRSILTKIKKSSSILGLNDCVFKKQGNRFEVSVLDTEIDKEEDSQTWSRELDCEVFSEKDFTFIFDISTFKMMDGDYEVTCNAPLTHFRNLECDLEYWVAMHSTSIYGE